MKDINIFKIIGTKLIDTDPTDTMTDTNVFAEFLNNLAENGFAQIFIDAYAVFRRLGFLLIVIAGTLQIFKMSMEKNKAPWRDDYLRFSGDILIKAFFLGGLSWIIVTVIDLCTMLSKIEF